MRSLPPATSLPRSKPSDATLSASSSAVSSNVIKTPGSLKCVAPLTRNSMASSVLPHPAFPHTSVGRPDGKPPRVISSRPLTPVRDLLIPCGLPFGRLAVRLIGACLRARVYRRGLRSDLTTFYKRVYRPATLAFTDCGSPLFSLCGFPMYGAAALDLSVRWGPLGRAAP